jgi:dTDP-4-amino-4,6-dideoxygalactose transaminase
VTPTLSLPHEAAPARQDTRKIRLRGVDVRLRSLKAGILQVIAEILESGMIEKGPYNARLAVAFQHMCGSPNRGVPCDSGTDALKMALLASGIGPGDEVIVPEISFMSTASAVQEVGATPVFVDVESGTATMSAQAAEAAITTRTRAIIPVHLFGMPVDVDGLLALGKHKGLRIIGDAAQAHGAAYHGRRVGNLGFDFECFSLAAVKNIGGWRFGGIVTFLDPDMELLLLQLSDLGRSPGESYIHNIHGLRATMDEMNAAVILLQLPYLEQWNSMRRAYAAAYDEALADLGPALTTPVAPPGRRPVYWQYCLRLSTRQLRDALAADLREAGIEVGNYPCVLSEQPSIKCGRYPYRNTDAPVARSVVERLLWIPIWPEMSESDRVYICTSIRSFFAQGRIRK